MQKTSTGGELIMNKFQRATAIMKLEAYYIGEKNEKTFFEAKSELITEIKEELQRIESISYEMFLKYRKGV